MYCVTSPSIFGSLIVEIVNVQMCTQSSLPLDTTSTFECIVKCIVCLCGLHVVEKSRNAVFLSPTD